jgi:hypothetical protein
MTKHPAPERRPNIDTDGSLRRQLIKDFTAFLRQQDAILNRHRSSKATARVAENCAKSVIHDATGFYMELIDAHGPEIAHGGALTPEMELRLCERIAALIGGVKSTFCAGVAAAHASKIGDSDKLIAVVESAPTIHELTAIITAIAHGPLAHDERVEEAVAAALRRVNSPAH